MPKPIKIELIRLAATLSVAVLIGLLSQQLILMLLLGLICFLCGHFIQLLKLYYRLKEGRSFPVNSSGTLWGYVNEHIRTLQIKSQKRKRRLSQYFSRFREAATALPDATVILERQGNIAWCNPASSMLLGLDWPEVAGKNFARLLQHPILSDYLAHGDHSNPLEFASHTDKTKVLSLFITPFGKRENQQLVVVRDITRLYHLDHTRRDFIANVSHELRTPLTVISGFLETMEETYSEKGGEFIPLMRRQAKRMEDTISDLLVLSRLEVDGKKTVAEIVDVPALLARIADEAEALSGDAGHQISLTADPALLLRGDKKELQSAFSNLVFNAVRHTPGRAHVHIDWAMQGKEAQFSVTDTGEGIPARHIPRLTERFYRIDAARSRDLGGTGLGLAIVKHILQHHGSKLEISSQEGKGSCFSCRFPESRVVCQRP
ncbi:MAG: phosphate regulon sensor histidine kinase PhoR [Candidatus Polarisedimenticolaceae bacterium]|nr:phosphate regulon sensor histidine kinase PhoR [Candidatus Polarisedimenticolaceae bacterium]